MDPRAIVNRIAELGGREMAALFAAGRPLDEIALPQGLWLGRNARMPWAMQQFVRHVMGRDRFAKLLLGDWGINVRVRQDGSHAPRLRRGGAPRLDLPFSIVGSNFDYGFHLAGMELGPHGDLVQLRDFMRAVDGPTFAEHVGLPPAAPGGSPILVGYIAPLGFGPLRGTPFGMAFARPATAAERSAAEDYVRKRRLVDTAARRPT